MVDQALDDGRRRESRQRPQCAAECEQLSRIDAARGRHDVAAAGHQVRDGVDAADVRHGGRTDHGVVRGDRVDVDEIAESHRHQVALRQHHALGPTGGAAGVEKPGQVVAQALRRSRGFVAERSAQFVGLDRLDLYLPIQIRQRARRDIARHEGPAGLGVVDDPFGLGRMQLGVDRHHQASPPRTLQDLEVARVVAHEQHDAVAGLHTRRVQPLRQARVRAAH